MSFPDVLQTKRLFSSAIVKKNLPFGAPWCTSCMAWLHPSNWKEYLKILEDVCGVSYQEPHVTRYNKSQIYNSLWILHLFILLFSFIGSMETTMAQNLGLDYLSVCTLVTLNLKESQELELCCYQLCCKQRLFSNVKDSLFLGILVYQLHDLSSSIQMERVTKAPWRCMWSFLSGTCYQV